MPRWLKAVLLVLVLALIGIQFKPVDRSNPPVTAALSAPAEVEAILARACNDCHSNETRWPWYSRVAPVSWMLAHHVEDGRRHLNFSEWGTYPANKQAHKAEEIAEEVRKGKMPLGNYVALHKEAKLSDADVQTLVDWTNTLRGGIPGGEAQAGDHEEEEGHEGHDH